MIDRLMGTAARSGVVEGPFRNAPPSPLRGATSPSELGEDFGGNIYDFTLDATDKQGAAR